MSKPTPFYTAHNLQPAYRLRFGWTGWPARGMTLPEEPSESLWSGLGETWEKDGLRPLERTWDADEVQITFSAAPAVSPTFLAARAKGRLQYAFRANGTSVRFARHFSVRSIGENTRGTVANYIRKQANRGELADPRFAARLSEFVFEDPSLDLGLPFVSGSGRYWYNLHIVLVVAERERLGNRDTLAGLRDMALRVGRSKGIGIAEWSIMPDHMHALLRPPPEVSPEQAVLWFQNNLAWAAGKCRFWEDTYYAGTCGEYTMAAVRRSR